MHILKFYYSAPSVTVAKLCTWFGFRTLMSRMFETRRTHLEEALDSSKIVLQMNGREDSFVVRVREISGERLAIRAQVTEETRVKGVTELLIAQVLENIAGTKLARKSAVEIRKYAPEEVRVALMRAYGEEVKVEIHETLELSEGFTESSVTAI